jgi:hypothetical protein
LYGEALGDKNMSTALIFLVVLTACSLIFCYQIANNINDDANGATTG